MNFNLKWIYFRILIILNFAENLLTICVYSGNLNPNKFPCTVSYLVFQSVNQKLILSEAENS